MYRFIIYYKFPILPTKGGVERVSILLGEWFKSQGHEVYYLSDIYEDKSPVFLNNNCGLEDDVNFRALESFISAKKIDFILNQAAFLPSCRRLFEIGGSVKIISIFHHSLDGMFAHPPIPLIGERLSTYFTRNLIFENIFRFYFYLKYHKSLKFVVKKSNKVVTLSKHYIRETERYACKSDNIIAIGNPLTLPIFNDDMKKENIIVFLGRLAWQKNPFLLLDIWKKIQHLKSEWKLYIIGDGDDRCRLETTIQEQAIPGIYLEGNKDPIPYLKRAKILCMTSVYEGFPLVLFEAMSFGVVPLTFDTFKSVDEIITNEVDGFVIPPFDKALYASKLINVMNNYPMWKEMSEKAREKALSNIVDIVGPKWLDLFDSIKSTESSI